MSRFTEYQEQLSVLTPVNGATPVDILQLPDAVAAAMRKMIRGGMSATELAGELTLTVEQALQVASVLMEKGYLRCADDATRGDLFCTVYFARMRSRPVPLDL